MIKYVIEKDNKLYVVGAKGFVPKNQKGILPEGIGKEDYPYLKADPIYDEIDSELLIGYSISVDEDAKTADAANRQQKKDDKAMKALRAKRDSLLSKTDFTQLQDAPLTEQEKSEYTTYRQALRDLPENVADVHNPVYPTKPGSN